MALEVEDGTGKSNAEAYISAADADTYHTNRGNTDWTGSGKEAALRKATDYMTQRYTNRWKGCRVTSTQALDWPRHTVTKHGFAVDSDEVPVEVQRACAELALKVVNGTVLAPDLTQAVTKEQVGPLVTEYLPGGDPSPVFQAIDMMLAPLLEGSSNSVRIHRA